MRCTSSVSWNTARLLRLILHLLRVKPFASYMSFYSESSRLSTASHHLRVIIYSKSSSTASHSSPSASHHLLQVIYSVPSHSIIYKIPHSSLEGLLDAFLGQEQVTPRVTTISCTKQVFSFRSNCRSSFFSPNLSSRGELCGVKYQAMNYSMTATIPRMNWTARVCPVLSLMRHCAF